MNAHMKFWHPVYVTAAVVTLIVAPAAAQHPRPDDVTVGKPADIPQELFAQVRTMCAARWTNEFDMRVFCEKKQFEAIRKLRSN